MGLATGTRLGPYEIQSPLGAGGMGEVYRARDSRLEREVAIKILPANLHSDTNLRQRLEREAKAVSRLSHPHICSLYDIGHQDGVDFLVMELLDGETLENRLRKGALPAEQTIRYSAQLADALATAHKLGFTHRDVKPGNIMLTKTGAKLMDFGLAKHSGAAPLDAALTEITAQPSKLTGAGMIVGTFQYMAPEQLEGKEADARTDIFALGTVIYEMATGKPAFSGKSRASLIASIMTTEPAPMTQIRPLTPPALERVVRKCLAKNPDERWQNAGDLAAALGWITESPSATEPTKSPRSLLWSAVGLAVLLILTLLSVTLFRPKPVPATVIRFSFAPPEKTSLGTFMAFSPDGSTLAFVATNQDGQDQIWLRRLNAPAAELLTGTDGASFPFWSPDSRYVGFFADRKLKVIPASGGPARALCYVVDGRGGAWSSKNVIVFSPHWQGGLQRIPAAGGDVREATTLDDGEDSHRLPIFLPDGNHFVYYSTGPGSPRNGLYLGSLDRKEKTRLADADSFAGYSDPGFLIFVQGGHLIAQELDDRSLRLTGDAIPLAESLIYAVDFTQSYAFAVSRSGSIAFRSAPVRGNELVWFDRAGGRLRKLAEANTYAEPALSHDNSHVAIQRGEDLVLINAMTGASSRVAAGAYGPTWSRDDKRIIFSRYQGGSSDIFLQEISDSGTAKLLVHNSATKNLEDWSIDGRYLAWDNIDKSRNRSDIFVMQLDGNHATTPFLSTPFNEESARFSPDGKWIAYTSDESGREEVYVSSFPNGGNKLPVSIAGGKEAYWRGDGREIFYLSPDRKLMAAAVKVTGSKFDVQAPKVLFRAPVPSLLDARSHYVPAADGQRFLFVADVPENQTAPINVVLNFHTELSQR